MNVRRVISACAVLALAGGVASADDQKKGAGKPDEKAMMEAYAKASEPVEQHKQVLKRAGKWNLTMKSWMDPKAPPSESTGTAEGKPLLGDRYLQTTVTASMPQGGQFSGLGLAGYDKAKKKFVGSWIDSMSTGVMLSEGTATPDGKTVTSQMVGTDPLTGKPNKMKIVEKWETDDKVVEEFYEKKGGKEIKTMEITYTRAK
jgi:hypothetical protein